MKHYHTQHLSVFERSFLVGVIKTTMAKRALYRKEILCLVHKEVGFRGYSKETIRSVLDEVLAFDPLVKYSV